MEKLILIKYGELTTKKENRKVFIKMLASNINNLLSDYEYEMKYDRVRMYITCDNKYIDEIAEKLSKIFGIHSIVICHKVDNNIDNIKAKVLEVVKLENFKTFKVETKRADKSFEIPSMEFNHVIGGLVLKNFDCKVDVHNPDLRIHIEIRPEGTFIYKNEIAGSGGYPVGIQGKGMLMLSGGIDSPVAGYLALKRGVNVECLYFESPPHTSLNAKNKVIKLASIINEYSGNVKVHVVPFTKLQEAIYQNCPANYNITIMRRMMYRIATKYAMKKKCEILINGESVGQVASQTITSMSVINNVTNMPVIRPVACLDKLEIIKIAEKIGTYETSILPFEDCCTIFLPKHPVINPKLEKCLQYESNFDYESLIDECIENIEVIKNLEPQTY
ncbi:MAG: tRNA 4-thiouridine(8) synthase ThiI, partial [Bacilli bacterium]|nr:tRNA 4-thiouridine(8) synthase ThiI [Bacilli bacterium]